MKQILNYGALAGHKSKTNLVKICSDRHNPSNMLKSGKL